MVGFLACSTFCVMTIGCGGDDTSAARQSHPGQSHAGAGQASSTASAAAAMQPTDIVSQLLDRVRRGGNDSNSGELLTKLARQELARIGRPFEFPGSPDTTYQVGQTIQVPNTDDTVWVQTYLSEPLESGESFQYEVVWTLRQESEGWRVSGFVVDQGEGLEPLEFDFENGDEIAARLAAIEQSEQSVTR